MKLRKATPQDLTAILELFKTTVTTINRQDYTPEQIAAWVQSTKNQERWQQRVEQQFFLLVEARDQLVGFGSITATGYLDLLYVHPDFQRMGIAQTLLEALTSYAEGQQAIAITSDVSITARPFFEKNGFLVLQKQENERQGQILVNYKMEKQL
ncbi:MAG TPA: GNAT family N-acetyltransferase [Microscillaceae bacterium]|nr:GNAT family N-acetyltransferase [Microscillaceae bacterium]